MWRRKHNSSNSINTQGSTHSNREPGIVWCLGVQSCTCLTSYSWSVVKATPAEALMHLTQALHALHSQNLCVWGSRICSMQCSRCVTPEMSDTHHTSGFLLACPCYTCNLHRYTQDQVIASSHVFWTRKHGCNRREWSVLLTLQLYDKEANSWDANGVTSEGSHTRKPTLVAGNESVTKPRTSIRNCFWWLTNQYLQHPPELVYFLESTNGKPVENTRPSTIHG